MKITEIKQQVKNQDRYSFYLDGKYSFSLSANEVLNQGLRVNQNLSIEQYEEIKKIAIDDKAYMRALDMLARRPRSHYEMKNYLESKGYNDNTISKILNKLSNRGYINDSEFARLWVENRRLLKTVSRRKLSQELQQKGINKSIISDVIEQDQTSETEVLKDLISKKKHLTKYQDKQKFMAYLVRQGFLYSDVKTALDDFVE